MFVFYSVEKQDKSEEMIINELIGMSDGKSWMSTFESDRFRQSFNSTVIFESVMNFSAEGTDEKLTQEKAISEANNYLNSIVQLLKDFHEGKSCEITFFCINHKLHKFFCRTFRYIEITIGHCIETNIETPEIDCN